jgi:hypothetical protein
MEKMHHGKIVVTPLNRQGGEQLRKLEKVQDEHQRKLMAPKTIDTTHLDIPNKKP